MGVLRYTSDEGIRGYTTNKKGVSGYTESERGIREYTANERGGRWYKTSDGDMSGPAGISQPCEAAQNSENFLV